jgi:hypothetical protein
LDSGWPEVQVTRALAAFAEIDFPVPRPKLIHFAALSPAVKLQRLKVAAVTPTDIDALHAEISQTRPVRANRVVEVLRKAFNLTIRWGWRGDNWSGLNAEQPDRQTRLVA